MYVASRADNVVHILKLSSGQLRAGWVNFASRHRVTPSGALRKNRTSGIRHLAGSTRDVGAADPSVAEVLRKWRFYELWPLLCSSQCVVIALASDKVTAIKIIPKATSSIKESGRSVQARRLLKK